MLELYFHGACPCMGDFLYVEQSHFFSVLLAEKALLSSVTVLLAGEIFECVLGLRKDTCLMNLQWYCPGAVSLDHWFVIGLEDPVGEIRFFMWFSNIIDGCWVLSCRRDCCVGLLWISQGWAVWSPRQRLLGNEQLWWGTALSPAWSQLS